MGVDDAPGIRAAVEHLVGLGHTPDRARLRPAAHGARPLAARGLEQRAARRRPARGSVRRGRLLCRVRSPGDADAARPPRPADRRRLRERPDGDGRTVDRGLPWCRSCPTTCRSRLRRRRDLRPPAAVADLGAHRRRGLGPRRGDPAPRAHRQPRPPAPPTSRTHASSCAPRPVMHPTRYAPSEWSNDETHLPVNVRRCPRTRDPRRVWRWLRLERGQVLDRPDQGVALEQPRGDRLGQERWSRSGTPRTPTRRSPPRRSRPARPPRRSSAPRSPRATPPAWSSTPSRLRCPQFQKQGGLVPLDDFAGGTELHRGALRRAGRAVQVAGREVLPDAVEGEPGDDLLQQGDVQEGRARPGEPAAGDLRRVPRHAQEDRRQQARRRPRSSPSPSSEFFQSWFDFYPLYAAESGGKQLVEDGKAHVRRRRPARRSRNFWAKMYEKGSRRKEKYNGDSFADGKAAMAIVGPWAIAVYKDKVDWGVVPVPTSDGIDAERDPHVQRRQERRRSTPRARTAAPRGTS